MTAIERQRELLTKATKRPWGVTHFSGGVSFAGPPTVYAGTDPEYGEPRRMPSTEADASLIVAAVNDRAALLDVVERAMAVIKSCEYVDGTAQRCADDRALDRLAAALDRLHALPGWEE